MVVLVMMGEKRGRLFFFAAMKIRLALLVSATLTIKSFSREQAPRVMKIRRILPDVT